MFRVILLVVLFNVTAFGKLTIKQQKQKYERSLNSSISMDREDRALIASWTLDFQVQRVNVATKYRMQMTRHKEHSFVRADNNATRCHPCSYNVKWADCVYLQRRQIRNGENDYFVHEGECLTKSTAGDKDRRQAVVQVAKEMRKWRKGYRYLVNTCNTENTDAQAADSCLIQYMKKDNYNQVIQRLIILKLQTMRELHFQLDRLLKDLEECLQNQLSLYLEKVREIMGTLNKCYTLMNRNESNTR